MGNYIKIDRKILDWEWYSNINTCRLFIHMLLKANWKDGKFEGKVIPRGSFVSSYPKLEKETQLTNREIRTAIDHLKSTGELTVKKTNRYSIFTINNYNLYQLSDSQNDSQATVKRQSSDSLTSAIEEKKEVYKESITKVIPKKNFVPPTVDEVQKYCRERNNNIDAQNFVDFYESKGWMIGKNKMKDWKAAVRNWERKEQNESKTKKTKKNFDQRTYDYNCLEKQLRENQNRQMKALLKKEENQ